MGVLNVQRCKIYNPDLIEFKGYNETKKKFDVPVDTLIIKMAILNDNDPELDDYMDRVKECETLDNFKNEAILQSVIYKETISNGGSICPAIVDFSYFEDKVASKAFLESCLQKCADRNHAKPMLHYLLNNTVADGYRLAMITMESALDYKSYWKYFSK